LGGANAVVMTVAPVCAWRNSAARRNVAVEAKEDKSYDLAKALQEIEEARQNREAEIGLFVFSKATAPPGLAPFARHGKHVIVVWDRDDPATDIYLRVGLSVAKALVVQDHLADEKNKDVIALRNAVQAISRHISALSDISRWATTVERNGKKIGKKAEILKRRVTKHLSVLEKYLLPSDGEALVLPPCS
jgi:hypothetical protein